MGFNEHLTKLLKHEGGYSNNPNDAGGETYKGITKKYYPAWDGWKIVDATKDKATLLNNKQLDEQVFKFYKEFYWDKLLGDSIVSDEVAGMLFNIAVNVGKNTVIKKVQRILKVTQDGVIGNKTIAALNMQEPKVFINAFCLEMIDFYTTIAAKNQNITFLRGWILRVMSFYYDTLK